MDRKRKRTYEDMFRLIAIRLEVEIVRDDIVFICVGGVEADLHVELSPTFFGDSEWRVLEGCT